MSRLYGPAPRELQDQFDSRRLADAIESIGAKQELDEMAQAFIASRDMFFLTTVDDRGRPTVSYKGGPAGFVKVLDARTIAFPSYDGNGMYLSMGNIACNPEVGFLFIDLERPFRIRVQGRAAVSREAEKLALFKEAELVVTVSVDDVWMNCPRYIHRFQKVSTSRYVPAENAETPFCEWKRIGELRQALPAKDQPRAETAGAIGIDEWMGKVASGADDV